MIKIHLKIGCEIYMLKCREVPIWLFFSTASLLGNRINTICQKNHHKIYKQAKFCTMSATMCWQKIFKWNIKYLK